MYNDVIDGVIELNFNLTAIPNTMEHAWQDFMFVKPIDPNVILVHSIVYRVPINRLSAITPLELRGSKYEFDVKLFKVLETLC